MSATDDPPPEPTGTPVREEPDDRGADTLAAPYGWH